MATVPNQITITHFNMAQTQMTTQASYLSKTNMFPFSAL